MLNATTQGPQRCSAVR